MISNCSLSTNLHGTHVDPLLSSAPGGGEDAHIAGDAGRRGGGAGGLDRVDGDCDDLPHARLRVCLDGLF